MYWLPIYHGINLSVSYIFISSRYRQTPMASVFFGIVMWQVLAGMLTKNQTPKKPRRGQRTEIWWLTTGKDQERRPRMTSLGFRFGLCIALGAVAQYLHLVLVFMFQSCLQHCFVAVIVLIHVNTVAELQVCNSPERCVWNAGEVKMVVAFWSSFLKTTIRNRYRNTPKQLARAKHTRRIDLLVITYFCLVS